MKCRGSAVKRILLLMVMMLCMGAMTALAAKPIDSSISKSISLEYPVGDIPFRLYKVASMDTDLQLSWTEQFKEKYENVISLQQTDAKEWEPIAQTLSAYVSRDHLEPIQQDKTDASGKLTFPIGEMGVYMIDWDVHVTDGVRFTPRPNLFTVPLLDEQSGEWIYDVKWDVKVGRAEAAENTVDRKVHKKWDDNQDAAKARPKSIEVQLLKNDEVYDTVTLNKENGWSYEWKDLDANQTWKVAEKDVPAGYHTQTTLEGTTFLITNTRKPGRPGGSTPPKNTSGGKLPQTGMLWWPVPILAMVGLVLFTLGWRLRRRGQGNE